MVIFGPIADAVNDKLATDLPNEFVLASEYYVSTPTSLKCYIFRNAMLFYLNFFTVFFICFFVQKPSPRTQAVRNLQAWLDLTPFDRSSNRYGEICSSSTVYLLSRLPSDPVSSRLSRSTGCNFIFIVTHN